MPLHYRTATPADFDALVQLWNEHAGWDTLTRETWAERFMVIPENPLRIVVGEDDGGRIAAQFLFIPIPLWVDGRESTAVRPFAPVVASDVRGGLNPMQHPVVAMFRHAMTAFRDLGDGAIYMLPDPRWRRLFKSLPQFKTATFPLLSRPLPLDDGPLALGDGYQAGPLTDWGDRVDALWAEAREWMGAQLIRDGRVLPWKVGQGDYTVTAVERGGDLVGLVASRKKGDRQWLVCDLVAADEAALRAALTAAINEGHRAASAAPDDAPIHKVSVLGSGPTDAAARALGLTPERYKFVLFTVHLDASIPAEAVAPERWTVCPND